MTVVCRDLFLGLLFQTVLSEACGCVVGYRALLLLLQSSHASVHLVGGTDKATAVV